jgi:hypothetical protein
MAPAAKLSRNGGDQADSVQMVIAEKEDLTDGTHQK